MGIAAAAVGLVVAAIVAGAIALGGGEDGGSAQGAAAGEVASGGASGGEAPDPEARPEPRPLSEAQLIAQADAICEKSQERYLEVRDLESEYSTDMPYAEALIRFARQRVRGLRELTPPPALARPYREYVAAQERVLATDEQALAAARRDDVAGVVAARDERDSEDELRERLAREIGFEVCSTPQS